MQVLFCMFDETDSAMNLTFSQRKSLNSSFLDIRNYLSGKAIGITRDVALLNETVKCLFSFQFGELSNRFMAEPTGLAEAYRSAFREVKTQIPTVFPPDEELLLDPTSIAFIHQIFLQQDFDSSELDPLSLLYQAFIGSEIRGNEGQFFTPHEAVKFIVEAIDPRPGETIIDPACGAGSFLSYSARYLLRQGANPASIASSLYGVEKDEYLANLSQAHVALSTKQVGPIVCGDSIERVVQHNGPIPFMADGEFDIVLANPPFGAKIVVGSDSSKAKFELGYKWTKAADGTYTKTKTLQKKPTPQVLFMELCVRLLKPGGRLGIVVPESLLTSGSTRYVADYLRRNLHFDAIIGMPENLFKTSGKGGTHTKTCILIGRKVSAAAAKANQMFMAEAKWCGHDSRGNVIPNNDLPSILANYQHQQPRGALGYFLAQDDIKDNVLAPRYYDPEPAEMLQQLAATHDLVSIGELLDQNVIEMKTGDEIGKLAYGTGSIPFIRTSDISNWEIKLDPKHGVSEEIYQRYATKQDVREGDILMVRDGTYLIGTCAIISKYDEKILYQSHLYKIRVNDKHKMNPYILLAALSSEPVKRQIQAKRFTLDIIDSLGNRIRELILPIPRDPEKRERVASMVERSIMDRIESRELARLAKLEVVSG